LEKKPGAVAKTRCASGAKDLPRWALRFKFGFSGLSILIPFRLSTKYIIDYPRLVVKKKMKNNQKNLDFFGKTFIFA